MLRLKKLTTIFAALAILGGAVVIAMAAPNDDQIITLAVQAINHVSASADFTFTINDINVDFDSSSMATTLSYKTNSAANKKITAQLGAALPTGIMYLKLSVADGIGEQTLSNAVAKTVIQDLSKDAATKATTYTVQAGPTAEEGSNTVTVTFTIQTQ